MTRKNNDRGRYSTARQRAVDAATQVMPMAKNAGMMARQTAGDAAAWAAPRVQDARSWAAPQLEQAGLAVRDKIAPAISEKIAPAISAALVEAAHRLDDSVPAPPPRRWPRVLGAFAMIAALGSAVAAVIMRRQPDASSFGAQDQPTMPDQGAGGSAPGRTADGDEESTVDGQMPSS